jgi:translation initiation factor 4G
MKNIVDTRKTSSRIRFMLQDVIDLRDDRWRPRRGDSNPKTMDEIVKEAERESLTQLATPQPHTMRGGKDERDRDRDRDRKRGRKLQVSLIVPVKISFSNYKICGPLIRYLTCKQCYATSL